MCHGNWSYCCSGCVPQCAVMDARLNVCYLLSHIALSVVDTSCSCSGEHDECRSQ